MKRMCALEFGGYDASGLAISAVTFSSVLGWMGALGLFILSLFQFFGVTMRLV
jgi:hypothetical protein